MMGADGLRSATEHALLAANYVATRLAEHYPVLYAGRNGRVAHECILDLRPLTRSSGVTVDDVAKRLVDYGFHAPTMSFPVPGTLMVEPTESENLEELDRFCDAMIAIRDEIAAVESGEWPADGQPAGQRPAHPGRGGRPTSGAHPYPRRVGAFPAGLHAGPISATGIDKYWPPVGRIDGGVRRPQPGLHLPAAGGVRGLSRRSRRSRRSGRVVDAGDVVDPLGQIQVGLGESALGVRGQHQRLGLAGTGGTRDETVAVDHGDRDADLRLRDRLTIDERSHVQRRRVKAVTGFDGCDQPQRRGGLRRGWWMPWPASLQRRRRTSPRLRPPRARPARLREPSWPRRPGRRDLSRWHPSCRQPTDGARRADQSSRWRPAESGRRGRDACRRSRPGASTGRAASDG